MHAQPPILRFSVQPMASEASSRCGLWPTRFVFGSGNAIVDDICLVPSTEIVKAMCNDLCVCKVFILCTKHWMVFTIHIII